MKTEIIKWGILGTGRIAGVFATALQVVENSELWAVGSRSGDKALEFASVYTVPKAYGSYEALVSDPEIDIIYIATPHNHHLEYALMAMNHGKHVLCEKPLAVNEKEVRQMVDRAREKKLFLMEALWSRFLPRMMKVQELISTGQIGEVQLLTASFCFKSSHTPEQRHFNIDLCGGTVLDTGIYNLFLAYFLLGIPQSIVSLASLNEQGADTSSSLIFKYKDESLAVMHTSFLLDAPVTAEIYGTKGSILLDNRWFNLGNIRLKLPGAQEEIFTFETKVNGYEYEAQEAVNCILTGKIQSDDWCWNDSIQLARLMDVVRKQCGIYYPKHDN